MIFLIKRIFKLGRIIFSVGTNVGANCAIASTGAFIGAKSVLDKKVEKDVEKYMNKRRENLEK